MDDNNWVPAPGQGAEPPVATGDDWRTQLSPEARQRVFHKLMETLRKHVPFLDHDQAGLEQVKKLAVRCEEKIYNTAVNQPDYMRKICIKMLTMESKSQNTNSNSLPSNSPGNSNTTPDSGASHNMQPQVPNSGQLLSVPMSTNQSQGHQEIMSSQNMPNNIGSTGMQSSSSLASALPPVSGLSQTSIPSVVGQNPTMQNTSGVPQNPAGSSLGQGVPSNNMFANSQRQIPGRQQALPQQLEQPQSPQQYLYQQQVLKQKFQQQGNLQHTIVPSNLQPQQQNLIHPTSQQSMQPSMIRSSDLSGMQQNQASPAQQSMLSMLQHPQSVLRQQHQAASFRQQQQPMMQQSFLPSQKHIMVQQPNAANMQKNQLTGPQQRLLGQQINLQNLQQHQQQLMAQKNNLSSMHQQQLGSQGNVSGLQQQQQRLGTQSGNSTMQSNQHSLHMMQHPKVPMQQQTLQNVANMLPTQGQQSQQQLSRQQMNSQIQSQPTHMQRQLALQQPNPLQLDMKPGLQASTQPPGALLQQQNVIDQQRQLYQSQISIPETSSTSLESTAQTGQSNGDDWREEVHQKVKAMKEMYLPELNELNQRIASKLQHHDSLPQQPKSEQPEKLKTFKSVLERMILYLHVSRDSITPSFKEKLALYEKQIMSFINSNRVRKPIPPRQQGHLGQPHIPQPQSQASQVQSHDNQMQGSVQNLQQNSVGTMQNPSLSAVSGVSTPQQNIMNSVQISSSLDSGHGKAIGSLQQTAIGPLQQVNATNFSSQSGVNMIQSNRNMLQHQQDLHSQHLMKQQMMQQQQQLYQQTKQHLPAQIQSHQMSQANQMNDVNELKVKKGMGVKPGVLQQHISGSQRYSHQQMKPGAPYPISSPQLLQTASPQLSEHSSPQMDQQNMLPSLTKAGTPLQSGNSPFMVPSPSTPLAPSPVPGDSEKPISGVSPLSKASGNIGQQQVTATHPSAPSLAIGTPGISASPLLAELTVSDGGGNVNDAGNIASGESNVTDKPLERLIKAVKSISSESLSAAVSDISSVVSMMDSIAGSAPDNTSRAAVGDNLVAMTNCRLQARKFIARDGTTGTRKMKRDIVSSAGTVSDRINISGQDIPDLESTATSRFKKPRIEPNRSLLEEIREINLQLVDTVVDVFEKDTNPTTVAEGGEGTIVKCSYIGAALSPNLKSQYASGQMSPIQPIRLLVPANYPSSSPEVLDKLPIDFSDESEDLSVKAKSRFERCLRCLQEPMSLEEIARTWDVCARAVFAEYAQQSGGGTFSSKYGTWVDCSIAA